MKSLAFLLIAFSLNAVADENSGYDTASIKCVNVKERISLQYATGRGDFADDKTTIPFSVKIREDVLKPELIAFAHEGDLIDNSMASEKHDISDTFSQGIGISAHVYDDTAQLYRAGTLSLTLRQTSKFKEFEVPSQALKSGHGATFQMTLRYGPGNMYDATVVLSCKAITRAYGS